MNLRHELPENLVNKYKLKDYEYSANFNLHNNKYVNGFLVVDNLYIYVFIEDKLINKYKIKDFTSVKCKSLSSGGYIYGIKQNKKEVIICNY